MTRIPVSVELRFLRVPARWARHRGVFHDEQGEHEEYFFAPEVDQSIERRFVAITDDDPWELRNQFLRMKHTEDAALEFLNEIGVWMAVEGQNPQKNLPKTRMSGAFGYRFFVGTARPVTLEFLWAEQKYWKELLLPRNRAKLAAKFSPHPGDNARPIDKLSFAMDTNVGNTLEIHLEMSKQPHAVIQTITGHELLLATAWVDLVRGAKSHVCQRQDCGIPFSGRKRKYCDWYCGHIVAVRAGRERKAKPRSRS